MIKIKLVRRPVSAKRRQIIVQEEVRKALADFSHVVMKRLNADVDNWDVKPEFNVKTTVSANTWKMEVKIDGRKTIGKIYGWIDDGVGEYGGKRPLPDIVPKRKKGTLGFIVPHSPKSLPNPSVPGIPSSESQHFVRAKSVRHPGIYPRSFTKTMVVWLKSKESGAFRSVLEAAIKRGLRKKAVDTKSGG